MNRVISHQANWWQKKGMLASLATFVGLFAVMLAVPSFASAMEAGLPGPEVEPGPSKGSKFCITIAGEQFCITLPDVPTPPPPPADGGDTGDGGNTGDGTTSTGSGAGGIGGSPGGGPNAGGTGGGDGQVDVVRNGSGAPVHQVFGSVSAPPSAYDLQKLREEWMDGGQARMDYWNGVADSPLAEKVFQDYLKNCSATNSDTWNCLVQATAFRKCVAGSTSGVANCVRDAQITGCIAGGSSPDLCGYRAWAVSYPTVGSCNAATSPRDCRIGLAILECLEAGKSKAYCEEIAEEKYPWTEW